MLLQNGSHYLCFDKNQLPSELIRLVKIITRLFRRDELENPNCHPNF